MLRDHAGIEVEGVTFSPMEIWFDDPDGTGPAFEKISGDVAAVNAHPWKAGPDVTCPRPQAGQT